MNQHFLYTKLYGMLHNYGMPYWIMTPVRRLIRFLANKYLPKYLVSSPTLSSVKNHNIIVSLTSFPDRIDDVWKVIACLKRQSVQPEKIILWLSEKQFPHLDSIPQELKNLEDDLFSLRIVPEDFRSHKKYLYAMREFPEKIIITCDDDVFYDADMIKRLVDVSVFKPDCIITNYASHITYDGGGNLMSYKKWPSVSSSYASDNLIQIGVGGVLYPPHSLDDMALNENVFMMVCPFADDIWLNAMARMKGTSVVKTPKNILVLPIISKAPSLCTINNGVQCLNDKQLALLRNYLVSSGNSDVYSYNFAFPHK